MSPSGGDPLDPGGSGSVLRGRCGIGLGVPEFQINNCEVPAIFPAVPR